MFSARKMRVRAPSAVPFHSTIKVMDLPVKELYVGARPTCGANVGVGELADPRGSNPRSARSAGSNPVTDTILQHSSMVEHTTDNRGI